MASKKKTFLEKLEDDKDYPRVVPLTGGMLRRFGAGTILIPAPRQVDALMRRVPSGRLITVNQIREALAAEHGASMCCAIVTGIHARVAAGAAGELLAQGRKRVTPFWRTLRAGGELNPKYPGGVEAQSELLEAEGHRVVARGKKLFVSGYEARLVRLDA